MAVLPDSPADVTLAVGASVLADPQCRAANMPEHRAYRCPFCDRPVGWRLDRRGDAVVTWACHLHLSLVAEVSQRPGERTELVLTSVPIEEDL